MTSKVELLEKCHRNIRILLMFRFSFFPFSNFHRRHSLYPSSSSSSSSSSVRLRLLLIIPTFSFLARPWYLFIVFSSCFVIFPPPSHPPLPLCFILPLPILRFMFITRVSSSRFSLLVMLFLIEKLFLSLFLVPVSSSFFLSSLSLFTIILFMFGRYACDVSQFFQTQTYCDAESWNANKYAASRAHLYTIWQSYNVGIKIILLAVRWFRTTGGIVRCCGLHFRILLCVPKDIAPPSLELGCIRLWSSTLWGYSVGVYRYRATDVGSRVASTSEGLHAGGLHSEGLLWRSTDLVLPTLNLALQTPSSVEFETSENAASSTQLCNDYRSDRDTACL
jgi:hypothetical protein